MLFDYFVQSYKFLIGILFGFLPSQAEKPLPDFVIAHLIPIFEQVQLFLELPVISELYIYFQIYLPFFFLFWTWNFWIFIFSSLPHMGWLKRLELHHQDEDVNRFFPTGSYQKVGSGGHGNVNSDKARWRSRRY